MTVKRRVCISPQTLPMFLVLVVELLCLERNLYDGNGGDTTDGTFSGHRSHHTISTMTKDPKGRKC